MSNTSESVDKRPRDRVETERCIIRAVMELIREEGFEAVGVSSVARRAGVSKILIYRYFGNFDGLLEEVGKELDPASIRGIPGIIDEGISRGATLPEILYETVLVLRKRLKSDDLSMNLMAWEMLHENEVTRAFTRTRESAGLELNKRLASLSGKASGLDIEAVFAVISSSIYYLLLRSRFVKDYNGIDIRSEEGWKRLARTMADMLGGLIGKDSRTHLDFYVTMG